MFLLFNLISIWNLPTLSIGERGRDVVLILIGPGARFFVHSHARKHPSMGAATHDSVPCYAGQFDKSFTFSIRLLSPLSYMVLNLACITQHFLHDSAILGHGASPDVAGELFRHRSPPSSPCVPVHPFGFEVGESSEEHGYLDYIDYRQLLKDYSEGPSGFVINQARDAAW